MATRRRARSGNNVLLGIGLGLVVVVFCAASTTTTSAVATPPPHIVMMKGGSGDDSGAAAARAAAAGLSVDFHKAGCQDLNDIVRSAVEEARRWDVQVTAGLLRIFFHDCFPQGCDASLLLDKSRADSEQHLPQNGGLQEAALKLVETIRDRVHSRCGAGSVSCADILALATSHAVQQAGGPFIPMELGRNDSRGPAPAWAVGRLPGPTLGFADLLASFSGRDGGGFDASDVVALSGAHTVGMAHCSSFQDRLDKKAGDKDNFEWGLTGYCNGDGERKHALDATPFNFDNSYFVELNKGRGVLTSDQALYRDDRSKRIVDSYASNQQDFFNRFVVSMQKLSRLRGSNPGPVRNHCLRPTNLAGAGDDDDLILAAAA